MLVSTSFILNTNLYMFMHKHILNCIAYKHCLISCLRGKLLLSRLGQQVYLNTSHVLDYISFAQYWSARKLMMRPCFGQQEGLDTCQVLDSKEAASAVHKKVEMR